LHLRSNQKKTKKGESVKKLRVVRSTFQIGQVNFTDVLTE